MSHHARTRRFATETFRKAAKFAIFEDSEVMIEDRSLRRELSIGIRKSIAQINGSQTDSGRHVLGTPDPSSGGRRRGGADDHVWRARAGERESGMER